MSVANQTDITSLSDSMQTYYDKLFLKVAKSTIVTDKLGQIRNLPKNSGRTVSFTRYTALAAATTALTEGTDPTALVLSDTAVTCTVYEYGAFSSISSLVSMTSIDPDISGKTQLYAQNAADTVDSLILNEIGANFTAQRVNDVALSDLASSDTLSVEELSQAVKTLKTNKAYRMPDGGWVAIVNPAQSYRLQKDSTFVLSKQYAGSKELYNGEIGSWMGIRILESTFTYRTTTAGAANAAGVAHYCPVMGAEAFGKIELENPRVVMNTSRSALGMYYDYGWRMTFGVKTLNSTFGVSVISYEGA
jgi:N4-gp56 family major capsid protein